MSEKFFDSSSLKGGRASSKSTSSNGTCTANSFNSFWDISKKWSKKNPLFSYTITLLELTLYGKVIRRWKMLETEEYKSDKIKKLIDTFWWDHPLDFTIPFWLSLIQGPRFSFYAPPPFREVSFWIFTVLGAHILCIQNLVEFSSNCPDYYILRCAPWKFYPKIWKSLETPDIDNKCDCMLIVTLYRYNMVNSVFESIIK